jgi:hypothetical protein
MAVLPAACICQTGNPYFPGKKANIKQGFIACTFETLFL